MTIIDNALAARRLTPLRFKCECCGDTWDRDEVASDSALSPIFMDAIRTRFGRNVCIYCAHDMRFCDDTGVALKDGEGVTDADGNLFINDEVADEYAQEMADNAAHITTESAIYRAATGYPFGGA